MLSEDGKEDDPHVTTLYGLKNSDDFEKVRAYLSRIDYFNLWLL
jgi:hypothetical protein